MQEIVARELSLQEPPPLEERAIRTRGSKVLRRKSLSRFQVAALTFAVWTAVGAFEAAPEMLRGLSTPVFLGKLLDAWAWALVTLALVQIGRKFASSEQGFGALALKFALLSVPFSAAHVIVVGLLYYPFPEIWWSPLRNSDFLVFYFIGGWVTYFAVVGILEAFRFHDRSLTGELQLERVERNLVESRLNALRLQLEPHFLFNTLNAISSELAENPALARDMLADLGTLLRRSLDSKDSAEITLAEELTLLEHYLSIQRVRYGDRLKIQLEVETDIRSAMVPPMLLQPLVENAIRHGIEPRTSGGKIAVKGWRVADELHLRVTDNGLGLPKNWRMEKSRGYGLRVTLERLRTLYPRSDRERLMIRSRTGGGTEVAIFIPLKLTGADDAIA